MIIFQKNSDFNRLDKTIQNMCSIFNKVFEGDVICTSGLRSPEENKKAGGVADSSHLKGLAIDLACADSAIRYKIIYSALASGFKRIGLAKDHVHLCNDLKKSNPIIFFERM